MCEIQFIKRYDGKINKLDFNSFKNMMLLGSVNNNDAFGLFNSRYHFKNKGRFNLLNVNKKAIFQDNFIIGHNRFSTGATKKNNHNNHPFILNGLTLVHNGIISNHIELMDRYKIYNKIQTDSFIIIALIDKFLNKYQRKNNNRELNIVKAIKKTCECLEGSYSCFLFDNVTNNIYYFKDKSTYFYAYFNNNVLICSTSNDNIKLTYLDDDLIRLNDYNKFKEIDVDEGIIYLINDDNKFKAIDVFDIKKSYSNYSTQYNNMGDYSRNLNKDIPKEDKIRQIDDLFNNYFDLTPNYTYDDKTDNIIMDFDTNLYAYLGNCCEVIDNKIVVNYYDLCEYIGLKEFD